MTNSLFRTLIVSLTVFVLVTPAAGTTSPPDTDQESSLAGVDPILATASYGVLGPYLVDGHGRALYLREVADSESSLCNDDCTLIWPPYFTPTAVSAGDSLVQDDLVGSTPHRDGMLQVTYNGWRLHYYALDDTARESLQYQWVETLGQAVHDEWGKWFLVTPQGEKLERLLHPPESY